MRKVIEHLLALQTLQFDVGSRPSASNAAMEQIRQRIPTPILAHYERLILRGKKGVAIARNGVCSECHLRITSGKLVGLVYTDEATLCDNCGRYLYLPEDEPIGLMETKSSVAASAGPPKRPQHRPAKGQALLHSHPR